MARKSHLYEYHKQNGKLTEFSGFDMPIWYSSIIDEHLAVRNAAGLFDVSHMGRVSISGRDATNFLQYLLPTDSSKIRDGRAFYSVMCDKSGGIIDDVVTNKFSEDHYIMVINAGNREKDLSWIRAVSETFNVEIDDFSNRSALLAFQGPISVGIMQRIASVDLAKLRRFAFEECNVAGERCLLSRTGYTGEDGFEITVFDSPVEQPARAVKIWNKLLELGPENSVLPCGLGARDSLRLEAGMCLYGQDIDEKITPVEAALENIVNLDKERQFVGKKVVEEQMKTGPQKRRIAFSMSESGIPRHGFAIEYAGKTIGTVTSGTFSPLLKKGIGMGYVPTPISSIGQKLVVNIRDSDRLSEIVGVPFYDTTKFGYKRKYQQRASG
ncbi:MAG: glycine cleavage system aminomethyltransferase GcvT [Nitrososphaerales archaeon]